MAFIETVDCASAGKLKREGSRSVRVRRNGNYCLVSLARTYTGENQSSPELGIQSSIWDVRQLGTPAKMRARSCKVDQSGTANIWQAISARESLRIKILAYILLWCKIVHLLCCRTRA